MRTSGQKADRQLRPGNSNALPAQAMYVTGNDVEAVRGQHPDKLNHREVDDQPRLHLLEHVRPAWATLRATN